MGRIIVTTTIRAGLERCFDLARDVEAHARTARFTAERVVPPGRSAGLLELGDVVTFEARHFGARWRHTARIVEMQRPSRFVDESVSSPFRYLRHTHEFRRADDATVMTDTLDWTAPLGVLGDLADWLFLRRHMLWFVTTKQRALRDVAEAEGGV